jgi:predicted DNA-binding transcriptional regulator AlpA
MSREVERKNKSMRRFYSMGEVEAITSLSRSTIYRKMQEVHSRPRWQSLRVGSAGNGKRWMSGARRRLQRKAAGAKG